MSVQQEPHSAVRLLVMTGFWYFVLAVAGILLTPGDDPIATLWYANALAVAFMYEQGRRRQGQMVVLVAVASFAANMLTGSSAAVAGMFAFANCLETVLVSYTIRQGDLARDFDRSGSQLLKLILLGFFLPCACSATFVATLMAWDGQADFGRTFTNWYVSAALGQTLIFPLLRLGMRQNAFANWSANWLRFTRFTLTVLLLVMLGLMYLPFPFIYVLVALSFAATRLTYEESHLLLVLVITSLGLMISFGQIASPHDFPDWKIVLLYLPILMTAIPPMLLSTSMNESRLKEAARLQALQELAHSQASLQATINHMPAMISYCDRQLTMRFANEAFLQWFGFANTNIKGMPVQKVIGEAVYAQSKAHIEAALAGEPQLFERTLTGQNEQRRYLLTSYVPHVSHGEVHGIYVFSTDISPLKQAQLQEQRTQARLQSLFAAASEFAIISCDLQGTIRFFSHGAERMLGYAEAEMVGLHTPDIIHLDSEMLTRAALLTAELGYPVQGFEVFAAKARLGEVQAQQWTYVHKDGSHIPVSLVISAVHNEAGQIDGFLGIAIDISRQQQLEASLIAARDQAEMASRTKSEFLANMSHEIRTPMNAVLGMSYLLGKTELNADQRNYLEMIRSSGQSLLGILNDILDISKIEAGRIELSPTRFYLKDILSALANMMSVNVGEKQLELSMGIDTAVPRELIGDALRLQQVLINITGNAIKFTEQGEVSLLVQLASEDGQGGQAGQDAGSLLVQFIIRDTGIGMSTEQISRMFSAFEQADASTSRRFGGTGLGLAISKRLVDLMDGDIQVKSQEGQGTEFIVSVPMQAAPAMPLPEENCQPASLPLADGRSRKILVVDDNATSRSYIAKTIEAWGWQADTASSGEQALQKVRERLAQMTGPDYDYCAILIDWHMPGQDGLATLAAIKAILASQHIPLILMSSAYDRSALNMDGKPDAPDAVLLKPVTGSSLYDVLQETSRHLQQPAVLSTAAPGNMSTTTQHSVAAVPGTGSFAGKQILLVEDNYFNQIVATKILEQTGAVVKLANNGSEAVEIMKGAAGQFDLVLMDVQMPIMDGWTATGILRKELAMTLPILAMTAGVMTSERERCLEAGMNDVISKPIDIDQMLAALARYLSPASAASASATSATANNEVAATSLPDVSQPAPSGAFDPSKLMALAKGNPNLIKTLAGVIQNMINHATQDFQQAIAHWQQGDAQQAARTLHTLRGSIGTLGAKDFAQAALTLENAISQQDQARIPALLANAEQQLQLTITSVQAWLHAHDASTAASAIPASQLQPEQLQEFKTLLQTQNMKASALYQELQASLQQHWPLQRQQAMQQAMLSLDFAAALDVLETA
ncbi:response regulator [Undibacterium pigrum]|uniref:Sensory/regulatory protein RpfC n=1 Tax=Undibacterium pigrum TaxID=401470 RepID=A0A318IN34_9BURK|nr:response regulator [Undibacterium pigrum]PXX35290.1 PAS domain S-box-containing protein [Undibacterium pigrum]